jgi:HPt (histidine-containing phosphotransfer) domain-containing protein
MSVDQITNAENERNPPFLRLAGVSGSMNHAVDLEVLNAFEELQSDDGSDLIVELIDLYLLDAPQRVRQISEASVAAEWIVLKRTAHNLKGSSGSLGLRKVAETCQRLEQMDGQDSPQTVAALVQLLEYEAAMASAELVAVRQRRLG